MSGVFDYYYGEESESCSFYRIPRLLILGERFSGLSTDAKLLYGLMLDRMNLSARNGWYDDAGRVYIYYTLEEIQESMSCGHGKAVRLLAELDTGKGIGLIERTKQGQGKPARIYVKRYTTREIPAPPTVPPDFPNQYSHHYHNHLCFDNLPSPESRPLPNGFPYSSFLPYAYFRHSRPPDPTRWLSWEDSGSNRLSSYNDSCFPYEARRNAR